jgi:DNA modification methylase
MLGDCLELLPTLEAGSVDAIVTDPPYGLEFMAKAWDTYRNRASWQAARPGEGGMGTLAGSVPASYTGGHPYQEWTTAWARELLRVAAPGAYLVAFGGTRTAHRLGCGLEDAGWVVRDQLVWIYATGFPKGRANLKPAHEPMILARKPGPLRELGIDAGRIGTDGGGTTCPDFPAPCSGHAGHGTYAPTVHVPGDVTGRWPANVLLTDGELFDVSNPGVIGSGAESAGSDRVRHNSTAAFASSSGPFAGEPAPRDSYGYADAGGYARYFLIPKPSTAERERGLAGAARHPHPLYGTTQGHRPHTPPDYEYRPADRANTHPTVKPLELMRHLVRLVTPRGGLVLDPFAGSGTTALAASEEGFRCIAIEREAEYLEITRGRLAATPIGLGL